LMTFRTTSALIFATLCASAAEAKNQPRSFRDCGSCPQMIVIPGGNFLMGSPGGEKGRDVIEGPQRAVRIRSFAVGKYDVTRGEWRAFVAATHRSTANGCQWVGPTRAHELTANWDKLDFVQTDAHPVVCVTWNDAQDYVRWLSATTHRNYRLLSEAQWEYAARGGTTTPNWWGSGTSHAFANHGTAKCCGGLAEDRDKWLFTSPVGAFPPNPFGLYDMSGNVLQFVADCFMPTYDPSAADGSPNVRAIKLSTSGDLAGLNGASSCDYRVVRGGDWGDQSAWIRSAARSFAPPPGPDDKLETYRSGGVGFRVARDMP
jgi:formylglycine-generating enzyme required for sulfatase activity